MLDGVGLMKNPSDLIDQTWSCACEQRELGPLYDH